MIELICKALTYMIEVIMVILIAGIPVVIGTQHWWHCGDGSGYE